MDIKDLYRLFVEHPEITTDSRNCPKDSIFFALKGETFNGNEYAQKALDSGCAFAVIDEEKFADKTNNRIILVDDSLKTLQALANYHRKQLGTKIIGVTGTNGKTTTKELISAVLSKKYNVLYTQGNFNNHIGVPKTLLRLTKDHEIAVIEMGANHPGEIKTLVEIVEPDCGIITNVGKAHLLGFGSFEGVIKTKGELYDFLRTNPKSIVFINNDNQYLKNISQNLHLIKYGLSQAEDLSIKGKLISCDPFLEFEWEKKESTAKQKVQTKLIGAYNIDNALAAATIGDYFGVSDDDINSALEEYTPSNNRSQLKKTEDNTLVIDAYNANPTSMNAALTNFKLMKSDNKMCILGDMKELGDASMDEHIKVLDLIKDCNFKKIWLVGEEFQKAYSNHPHIKEEENCIKLFKDVDEVRIEIENNKPKGYIILIKGSNSTKLINTIDLL